MKQTPLIETNKRGSVLLITLLVVSLLMLVVVTFSIYVRLELREVVNRQQLLQARASARLSANLAIAQLQEAAGHDQRITLPAWSDRGVPPTIPYENRFFSGARDARAFLHSDSGGTPVLSRNPDYGQHQGWMVSNGDSFDITQAQFTSSGGLIQVAPTSVLMVGGGSADPTLDRNGNGIPDDFVAVPVENVRDPQGRAREQLGYFVMDEGTKARLNQFDPFPGSATPEYSRLMAQKAAVPMLLPGFDATNETHRLAVSKIHSDPQWELLEEAISGPQSETMYQRFFHAVTSHSLGLPVNVASGGLKKDLTAILEQMGTGPIDPRGGPYTALIDFHEQQLREQLAESLFYQSEGDYLTPVQKGLPLREHQVNSNTRHKVFPPSSYQAETNTSGFSPSDPGGPQWRQLLSFLNLGERAYDPVNGTMEATVHSDAQHGTPPVLSRFHIRIQFTLTRENGDYLLGFHLIPNIALWNPYDVPLRMPETYLLYNMSFAETGGLPLHLRIRHPSWPTSAGSHWMPAHHLTPMGHINEGKWNSYPLMLKFPETVLQPGESLWFELEDHVEMGFASGTNGTKSGGFTYFRMEDGNDASLGRTGPAALELDVTNTSHYAPMKAGLDPGGSKSLYVQENLTWRTKSEAGGYARRARSDWDTEPVDFARSQDLVRVQPDVQNFTLWHGSGWKNPWNGNADTPSGVPKYPVPSFQYATPDDPGTLRTFTFASYSDASRSGYQFGSIPVNGLPLRRDPLRANEVGHVVNRVLRAGRGNPELKFDAPLYNPWLRRENGPHAWPEQWKNKKVFPVTFNESGIIYSFGPDDPPAPVSIAVDKQGITSDWIVEEIRLAAGHEDYRSDNPNSDWPSTDFGKGALLMGPDITQFRGLNDNRKRPQVFLMAFNLFPAWPKSLLGDPWDPAFPGPKFTSLPSWNGTAGFIEGVSGDSFGIVLSLRTPEHGMTGDEQVVYQLPWLSGYNPMSTYLAGDPMHMIGSKKLGSGNPMIWVGGVTEDPDLLDPMRWTPDDRTTSVGHSFVSFSETRTVLKHLPRSLEEFSSIGQLMHANPVSFGPASMGSGNQPIDNAPSYLAQKDGFRQTGGEFTPAYAIGGGRVSDIFQPSMPFRMVWTDDPDYSEEDLTDHFTQRQMVEDGIMALHFNDLNLDGDAEMEYKCNPTYDASFYLNNALWDDYMLTGTAHGRLRWAHGVVDRDFHLSASRVLVEGAFNINSASPGAWASLLAAHMDMEIPVEGRGMDTDSEYRVPMLRTLFPSDSSYTGERGQDYTSEEFYGGFRRLRPDEIYDRSLNQGLAVEIVRAIGERGPFTSLADFVNRDPGADAAKYPHASAAQLEEYRRTSPLQMAIDRSRLNGRSAGVKDASGPSIIRASEDYSAVHADGRPIHFWRHTENTENLPANLGAPGTVTQQDILAQIGGFIQVRSDTFKIRAYGASFNDSTRTRTAQAWCELVVQRRSDYVDTTDAPEVRSAELQSPLNQWLGRRVDVLSFRWLSPEEI